ncbi:MAG: RluA family pseudouridine synthase [Desulfobacterota bacterium]|nr:RluA family pseudouridine synthase [Thermodesulfobacteriota bacterium]
MLPHETTQKYSFTVDEQAAGYRLDQAVAQAVPKISRTLVKKLIAFGAVWVNGKRIKRVSTIVHPGDEVCVYPSNEGCKRAYEINPAHILYEDRYLIFYRKEPGIPSQATPYDDYNNVAAAILRYKRRRHAHAYVGVHHRLDRDTSGVMLFTLSPQVNRSIHEQFKQHQVVKTYLALVHGNPEFQHKEIVTYITRQGGSYQCNLSGPGKQARTTFTVCAQLSGYALVKACPLTGRTHQLRLQLAYCGHPVLGDPLYGGHHPKAARTMLHAASIEITHPVTEKKLCVQADMFDDMLHLMGETTPLCR